MPNLEHDVIMTAPEVAAYLRLAESTVYRLARSGKLPGRKVGGKWRFSRKQLDLWLTEWPAESPNADG